MSSIIGKSHWSLNFSKCHVVTAHVGAKFLAMDWSHKGKECGSKESSRLWGGALRDEPENGFQGAKLALRSNKILML